MDGDHTAARGHYQLVMQIEDQLLAGNRGDPTAARWCDRYPNRGKQSGAFSCGSFDADPFILMNFKEEVLNDVFTLTHESGHSIISS